MLDALILCISLFTGLPVVGEPAIVLMPTIGNKGFYVSYNETVVLGMPSSWLLAHEVTHHLQYKAGVPYDENQADMAAFHYIGECK